MSNHLAMSPALPSSPKRKAARVLTEVLAPAQLALLTLVYVSWRASESIAAGLGWGLLAALFVVLVPYGVVLLGVRAQRWTDHHLRVRQQRFVPLCLGVVSAGLGLYLLHRLAAPSDLIALVIASIAGLLICLAVTVVWKMSVHAGVIAGAAVIVALTAGAATLAITVPLILAAAWSRVVLKDHTKAQVITGAIVGALVAGLVFTAAR
ncbi:phosphoesterase PA-phosphatase [Kineococcus sp. SYSU DK006]|uniref:phosphoesterase PA-phosphatase n=1 Tax=Kineococcus sp. SYSU DK006 TaxID=3383127 RepID=UPI003D7DFD77